MAKGQKRSNKEAKKPKKPKKEAAAVPVVMRGISATAADSKKKS